MNINSLGRGACPICGNECDFKLTKKGKVYIVCSGDEGCGSQVFARGHVADAKLRERIKKIEAQAQAEIAAEKPKAPTVTVTKHSSDGGTVKAEKTVFDYLKDLANSTD